MTSGAARTQVDLLLPPSNAINLVRLVLVSLVVLSHSFTLGAYALTPQLLGNTVGTWALAGLFSLSGFLVAGGRERMGFVPYVLRRIWRMWPAFLACLLVIAFVLAPIGYVIQFGTIDGYLTREDGPFRFLTLNAFLEIRQLPISSTPYERPTGWVGNLWTVSHTAAAYVVLGAVLGIRDRRARLAATCAIFVLSVVGHAQHEALLGLLHDARVTDGLLRFLPFFAGGAIVQQLQHRVRIAWPLAAVCTLVVVGAAAIDGSWGLQATAPCIAYALLWVGSTVRSPGIIRRHDVALGVFFYGYAVQVLLGMLGVAAFVGNPFAFFVVSMLATAPFAVGSWLLVERPLLRRRRQPDPTPSVAP